MKNIKLVISLVFLAILLTACDVNYQVTIDRDLAVKETLTMSISTSRVVDKFGSVENFITVFESEHGISRSSNDYDISYETTGGMVQVTIVVSHSGIVDFLENSPFYRNIYEEINIDIEDATVEIKGVELDPYRIRLKDGVFDDGAVSQFFPVENIIFDLKAPGKIISSNSDNCSRSNCSWEIRLDDEEMFSVTFNRGRSLFADILIYVLIAAAVIIVIKVVATIYKISERRADVNEV